MIEWSLDVFRTCESVRAIVVAAPPGHVFERDKAGASGGPGGPLLAVVDGGATRAQSVSNALAMVETELVAIHDAARPLVTPELVDALVADLDARPTAAAVIAAAPITDTVKQAAETPNRSFGSQGDPKAQLDVERTLDRGRLWAAQTPQVFRAEALRAALVVDSEARDAATDEAMLVEAAGGTVLLHPASSENLKVTTQLDLRLAELLLADRIGRSIPQ